MKDVPVPDKWHKSKNYKNFILEISENRRKEALSDLSDEQLSSFWGEFRAKEKGENFQYFPDRFKKDHFEDLGKKFQRENRRCFFRNN